MINVSPPKELKMNGIDMPKNMLDLLSDEDLYGWDRWSCSIVAPKDLGSPPHVTVRLENKDGWLRDVHLSINRSNRRGHLRLVKLTADKRNG